MSETEKNIWEAVAGESQANRKYLAFAKKAEDEGYPNVAKLFRAVADAETIHALNHLNAIKFAKTTKENLKAAADGEVYEYTEMYPKFLEKAKEEGNSEAAISFDWALKVEKVHDALYKKALEKVEKGEKLEDTKYFVCQTCGYTVENKKPDVCPICGRKHFKEVA